MNSKHFGLFSGVVLGLVIVFFTFVLRINLIFIDSIGKIPFFFWLVSVIGFLVFTFLGRSIKKEIFNWLYLVLALVTFIYLNSALQWSIDCCPEDYESRYDWNASKSLVWIVHLPIVFIAIIIQGVAFDLLRERNFKRNST